MNESLKTVSAAAPPTIVIIGAGFAGLHCARELTRAPVRVTLVDRRNHHLFQPLLYQVATAGLNPDDIAVPTRSLVHRQKNLDVVMAEVQQFDLAGQRVIFTDGSDLPYDYLLVATGVTHSYFGRPEWGRFAPGLKTVEDALEIRRRVFKAFEDADREPDPQRREALLTFVIVGAGPTGVELAGALVEIARHTLRSEFRRIDPHRARILLLEGTTRVLPAYTPDLSAAALRQLNELGVEVRTNARVTGIDGQGVAIGEERIPARTVLWSAGVVASPLAAALGVPFDRAGRVKVHSDLTIPGREEVYVAGDLALTIQKDGTPTPGIAPAAIQGGRQVAHNILRTMQGKSRKTFHYRDRGALSTIGRHRAVGYLWRLHVTGTLAWFAWLFIHIFFLIGFKNRFMVLAQWAWYYLTYGHGARVIVDTPHQWQFVAADAEKMCNPDGELRLPPTPPP